ncbi:MAG: TraR/DksA family transcriptional regulator [Calditrichaeota bacterium]|nr:TraR/DksA family transcriptional regulator [Calditrichota bacterium]
MTSDKLQEFKELLLKKRKETLKERDRYRELLRNINSEEEDFAKTAYKFSEFGTATMNREQSFLFLSRMDKYLQQIDRALEMIEVGTYGICRVCGKEIDEARLKAVPTTRICFTCKQNEAKAAR